MTDFKKKTFHVTREQKAPAECKHGWLTPKGACVMCGKKIEAKP